MFFGIWVVGRDQVYMKFKKNDKQAVSKYCS